jgi:hypothetical protein
MLSSLDVRKIRCWDGIHYSYAMLRLFHPLIYSSCLKIKTVPRGVVNAIAACWGFVDAMHRLREISLATPGLNQRSPEMRKFLQRTADAEACRHTTP